MSARAIGPQGNARQVDQLRPASRDLGHSNLYMQVRLDVAAARNCRTALGGVLSSGWLPNPTKIHRNAEKGGRAAGNHVLPGSWRCCFLKRANQCCPT